MSQYKTGDKAVCAQCGKEIEYVWPYASTYWRHIPPHKPRHIAKPLEGGMTITRNPGMCHPPQRPEEGIA